MIGVGLRRMLALGVAVGVLSACVAAPPASTGAPAPPPQAAPASPVAATRPAPAPAAPARPAPAPPVEPLPESFESDDFVVVLAKAGDTPESLAGRYLGDATKGWLIEDYNGTATFTQGREVVIPKRPWNPSGVESRGYQLVPILCYHNLGPQTRGRLLMSASAFEEQMRYLKREGYHVITLKQFLEFTSLRQQLPRKTVVSHVRRRLEVLQGVRLPHPEGARVPGDAVHLHGFHRSPHRPHVARAQGACPGGLRHPGSLQDARRHAPQTDGVRG